MIDWLIKRFCEVEHRRGNCYLAVLLYRKYAGALIVTKSAGHPIIPHIAWTDRLPPFVAGRMGYRAVLSYIKHGGNMVFTKSGIAWTDQLPPTLVRHFIPVKRQKGWRALFYSPWFKGKWETRVIQGREAADATYDSGRHRVIKT